MVATSSPPHVCVSYDVLKDALLAKEKVEAQLLKFYKFTTDYTIIRPGGLITAPATGKAQLTVPKCLLSSSPRTLSCSSCSFLFFLQPRGRRLTSPRRESSVVLMWHHSLFLLLTTHQPSRKYFPRLTQASRTKVRWAASPL